MPLAAGFGCILLVWLFSFFLLHRTWTTSMPSTSTLNPIWKRKIWKRRMWERSPTTRVPRTEPNWSVNLVVPLMPLINSYICWILTWQWPCLRELCFLVAGLWTALCSDDIVYIYVCDFRMECMSVYCVHAVVHRAPVTGGMETSTWDLQSSCRPIGELIWWGGSSDRWAYLIGDLIW